MSAARAELALWLALAAIASGCGGGDDDHGDGDGEPIEIGVLASITGDLASAARGDLQAMGLAIGEINDAGGVLGRDLALYQQDDGTTPDGSRLAYASLLNHQVPGIIGPSYSEGVVAIGQQLREGGTVTIGSATTSPALTELDDGGNFFRTCPSDAVQGIVLAQLIAGAGRHNICLVYRQDAYGSGLAEALMAGLDASVNVVEAAYDPALANLSTVMDQCDPIAQADGRGVVFITFEADGRLIIDDAALRGWGQAADEDVFMADGNKKQEMIDALAKPDAVEGALGTSPSGPMSGSPGGVRLESFKQRFADRYGEPAPVFAENAYDAVYALAAAIEIAGSASDRAAIRAAMGSLSSGEPAEAGNWGSIAERIAADGAVDYLGASGELELDLETGDLLPPFYITVWTISEGVIEDGEVITVD